MAHTCLEVAVALPPSLSRKKNTLRKYLNTLKMSFQGPRNGQVGFLILNAPGAVTFC